MLLIFIDNIFGFYVNYLLYFDFVKILYNKFNFFLVIMDLLNYKCGVFDDCWIMGVIKLMNMLSNLFGY